MAHELGHNLGMDHDFVQRHKKECNGKGIMSYGEHPMVWSTCSRADFEAQYMRWKDDWCMEEIAATDDPCLSTWTIFEIQKCLFISNYERYQ